MTIYVPVWLYWYGVPPLVFILGYLLGWTRKSKVPPDPYRYAHYWTDEERDEYEAMQRGRAPGGGYRPLPPGCPSVESRGVSEAPTTKREQSTDAATRDGGES